MTICSFFNESEKTIVVLFHTIREERGRVEKKYRKIKKNVQQHHLFKSFGFDLYAV